MFPSFATFNDFADDVDPSHPYAATGFADEPPVVPCEFDRADLVAEHAAWEASHCFCCGAESRGVVLGGVTVPMCDRCTIAELVANVGAGHVRDVVSRVAPAFAR